MHKRILNPHKLDKKTFMNLFFSIISITTAILMFLFPDVTTSYAKESLLNWLHNVLPALYPFMVLQTILIDLSFDEKIGKFIKPILKYIFPLSETTYFVIPTGFLCGFPMGAVATVRLYKEHKISKQEAEILLAFCNNIGPIYTLTMILPLFGEEFKPFILLLIYGIPFLYGIALAQINQIRYPKNKTTQNNDVSYINTKDIPNYGIMFTNALKKSGESILTLGGCMIFFSILRIFLEFIPAYYNAIHCYCTGLLEIGSFITILSQNIQQLGFGSSLFLLSTIITGGLSCIMQTNSIIAGTDLSLVKYILHKLLQTVIWSIICIILFSLKM